MHATIHKRFAIEVQDLLSPPSITFRSPSKYEDELAELLFYWEDWWIIAAIRTEQPR
jgi:hypothetical protein